MENKEIEQLVELLYPFFLKKLREDSFFKNVVKIKNATVVSISADAVTVKLPYDTVSFSAINKTGETLNVNDNVCILYWIDLKNAVAIFKVKE